MRIRFAGLELDEDRRELRRNGEALAVEPRVFDLIAYLVRHRERTVSKDELLAQLWPDREVQEGALSVCIHRARRILEESGTKAIQTEARRGYRFIATVELLREGMGGPRGRDLLVGRSAELAELHRAVEEILPSRLRTVEVAGDAGIGKTALLEEFGTYGRRHKLEVWRATSPDPADRTPYCLFTQLINAYMARYDARSVRRTMGEDLAPIARIVPSLRRWAEPRGEGGDPAEDRMKLLDSLALAVTAVAAQKPEILLFDDADESDADSMAAMSHVLDTCGQVPLLIVVSYRRETDVLAGMLAQMRALPGHRRISLGGLGETAVRDMLDHLAGEPVGDECFARALAATSGRPAAIESWMRTNFARKESSVRASTRATTTIRTAP